MDSYRIAWDIAPSADGSNGYEWVAVGAVDEWRGVVQAENFAAAVLAGAHALARHVEWLLPVTVVSRRPEDDPFWSAVHCLSIQGIDFLPSKPIDTTLLQRVIAQLPVAFPSERSQVSGPTLTVATDGSTKGSVTGWGWVALDRRFGLGAFHHKRAVVGPSAAVGAELRAIGDAVEQIQDRRLRLLIDSQSAIGFVEAWQAGDDRLPDGYTTYRLSGRLAGLVRIQQLVYAHRDRIDLEWVQGHIGHALNEAADALARLARRHSEGCGMSTREYRKRAEGLVEAFVNAFKDG